ncbi:protein of unknown function [Paenibacillus alvei]|uniref:Uncharacterized protein n=1 Tax=Paenibacillus alvei TaxID=44250 RepID=A0A383RAA0_PAEAL|nr:protein of unknown function [Paenibacillus alvei]
MLDKKSIPPGFQAEFDSLLSAALKSIINKEETLDDAVAELQIKGQEMFERLQETR